LSLDNRNVRLAQAIQVIYQAINDPLRHLTLARGAIERRAGVAKGAADGGEVVRRKRWAGSGERGQQVVGRWRVPPGKRNIWSSPMHSVDHCAPAMSASHVRQRIFTPLLQRAELPLIRFHDLRHTAATLLVL